jgi:hypothetical protein
MTKLIVAFRNFANTPKMALEDSHIFVTSALPPSGSHIIQPIFLTTKQVYQYLSLLVRV